MSLDIPVRKPMDCQCTCHWAAVKPFCQCCSEAILRNSEGVNLDRFPALRPKRVVEVAEVPLDKIKIGEALHHLRLDRRITATYAAAAAGTSLATINAMGRNGVSTADAIKRYAAALGLEAVIVFRERPTP